MKNQNQQEEAGKRRITQRVKKLNVVIISNYQLKATAMSLGGSSCQQSALQVQAQMEHLTRLDFSLKHVYSGCLLAVPSGFVAVVLKHSPIPCPFFIWVPGKEAHG